MKPTQIVVLLLSIILFFPVQVCAATSEHVMTRAYQVMMLFSSNPKVLENVFTDEFIKAANPAKVFSEYYADLGPCKKVLPQREGVIAFYFEHAKVSAEIQLDSRSPHKISGLWLGNAVPLAKITKK